MRSSITRRSRNDRREDLLLVSALLADARPCHLAAARVALRQERGRAHGARLAHRPRPEGEVGVGVIRAGEERLAAARAPLDELAPASRFRTDDAKGDRLGGLALRISRAGDELAEAPVLDHHRLAAGRAELVGRLPRGLFGAPDTLCVIS